MVYRKVNEMIPSLTLPKEVKSASSMFKIKGRDIRLSDSLIGHNVKEII